MEWAVDVASRKEPSVTVQTALEFQGHSHEYTPSPKPRGLVALLAISDAVHSVCGDSQRNH